MKKSQWRVSLLYPSAIKKRMKVIGMEYEKGHTGSNFRLDLRIVLFGSWFNLGPYF
jgi:hypothetical protein